MRNLELQLLIAVFSVVALHAQSNAPAAARLVARSGIVEVERGNMWLPIAAGEPLNAGERIRTANNSSAAVEVGPGKVITLNERTEIQVRQSSGSPLVQLENGSIKVFAATDIQVAAKDTMFETAERPLDMELGYQADRLNLTVFNGAVRSGSMTVRGPQDSTTRTYTANGRSGQRNGYLQVVYPNIYIYPYFLYGNPGPNAGVIVPPVVNNPTNPGYRPTQIVPPMSDPIRTPVTRR